MGYDATGWVTVVSTEESLTLMALQENGLAERAGLGRSPDGVALWEKICDATGLEWVEENTRSNGDVEWVFDYRGRWHEKVGDVFAWMAECGTIVRGEFQGEDGYRWLYRTQNGTCSEIGLSDVPYTAKTTLDKMRTWISVNGLSEVPDDLATLLGRLEEDLRWLE